ncbi:formiminoglutamase [Seinonella peptonophila]|uniref:Formiminoglutamase n=1 Tax=Seinonella peptonophila TaxID=112248 RepID=A0A1M4W8B9_9BACL|nr:agmatinase family protein [Seinonella peptonophila]SHE77466.1 formiminoglutamase [Seinonella peptonophila]
MLKLSKLHAPSIRLSGGSADPFSTNLAEWIRPVKQDQEYDLCLMGVPLSKSSISFSGAHLHPQQFRKCWTSFTTYNWEQDIDLKPLRIADLGDIEMHITDIAQCHQNIYEANLSVQRAYPEAVSIAVGGDHSITAPLVKAIVEATGARIGIIQFDAHLDVRDLSYGGASNGTPMRNLIESNTIRGEDIVTIGLRNFANSRQYRDYAEQHGMNLVSQREVQQAGIETIIAQAMAILDQKCDQIYVTFDIDVLDQSVVPGVPAIGPQGLLPVELFESAYILGKWEKVQAIDFVCVDPSVDFRDASTRVSLHIFLHFLSGFYRRKM